MRKLDRQDFVSAVCIVLAVLINWAAVVVIQHAPAHPAPVCQERR